MTRRTRAASAFLAGTTALLVGCSTDPTTQRTDSTPLAAPIVTESAEAPQDNNYRDGQYSATGWYGGLPSSIDVTLTLENDLVTDVDVTPNATNPTSLDLQQRFAEAVPAVVVGRDLADLEVDKLAGSSGTPTGFNDALEQIRDQATSRQQW